MPGNLNELNNKNHKKKDILIRLRKIEGQVKGIEKMVSEDLPCRDILVQVAAVRSAMNKVGAIVLENYANKCIVEDTQNLDEKKLDELIKTLIMFTK
ncbi:metal-sensitive transcriptional regulator [Hathewaya massiliensis]|uniref:metal-sensitive transcriptional regulator n=1 Tax=Hathewaya massiliensis TaxID=1964382 RepID=UPI00115830E2|nr:metal-sensitive transcriptional regulator [Hathewaya massiliensis]